MTHRNCPDCSSTVATKTEKARMAFLGGTLACGSCGAKLKPGGRFFSTLVGTAVGSDFLYVVVYSLAISSWLPAVAVLLWGWCLVGTSIYFSRFKRVGTKQFHI